MYSLPSNIDLSFFVGKQLIQLCIGEFEFQLNFDDKISISVFCEYTFDKIRYKSQESDHQGHVLHKILGKKVVAAKQVGKKLNDLELEFENNKKIILHDDGSDLYQSYTFWGPKGLVVV